MNKNLTLGLSMQLPAFIKSHNPTHHWLLIILATIPLIMVIAHHSLVAMFIGTSIVVTIFGERMAISNKVAYLFVALGYMGISCLWSLDTVDAIMRWGQITAITLAGITLYHSRFSASSANWILWGWVIGATLLILEILNHGTLYLFIHHESEWLLGSKLNQATSVISLIIWPILAMYMPSRYHIPAATAWAGLIFLTHSETTCAAVLGGVATLALCSISLRLATYLITLSTGLFILFGPWIINILDLFKIPDAAWVPTSLKHRFHIWRFCQDYIQEKLIFGWGLETPHALSKEQIFSPSGFELSTLHPHNIAIQIWFELGFVGALGLIAGLGWWLYCIQRDSVTPQHQSLYLAQFVTFFGISSSAYGIWQSWWMCAIITAILAFRYYNSQMHRAPNA
jgi:exopolysaccharide production protein ExoQ